MLLQFKFKNFLSFKDEVFFDLEAEGLKEKKEHLHRADAHNSKLNLLKSAAILGYNAYGKSNFIKAYSFFHKFILSSFNFGDTKENIDVTPFLFNTESQQKPTEFEIVVVLDKSKYRYGFKLNKNKILEEWLYYNDGPVRENALFFRVENEISIVSKSWNELSRNRAKQSCFFIKSKSLFLSLLIEQENIPRVNEIANWFKGNIILKGNYDLKVNEASSIYEKEEYSNSILKFIDYAELGFTSIYNKISNLISKGRLIEEASNILFGLEKINFDLYANHNLYDENKKQIGQIQLDFLKNESSGTIKYFILASFMSFAIKNSQLIIIDELDASLSTQLLEFLLATYHEPKNNFQGSQLIFVCHNTIVLDKKLRRDQIWFVDKNEYGESTLLKGHNSETPVRIDRSLEQDFRMKKTRGSSKKISVNNLPSLFD
jgi:uncharacterized protein